MASGPEPNHYLMPCVFEVVGVRKALAAIADNGNFLALKKFGVRILIVVNFHFVARFKCVIG
jgi:hypothetical protein